MAAPLPLSDELVAFQTALAGQYFLERELGRGGMGVVYLAREVRLDRPVAIKLLPPALAARPELRERFLREARTAAKLSHPNIVPIFRVDEATAPAADGAAGGAAGGARFVYFAMAFVDGETLGDRLRARGTLPPREVARLLQEVGWALAYAHRGGVVHRDVKPDNILLERGSGRALVTDFGIAQLAEARSLTGEGMVMGTAHYMSPEQAAGEPLDGRSDLYSLGVVAYQALAGRPPFDAPEMRSLLAMHLTQPPPPLPPAVPRALADAVGCCLRKNPAERFATGEALAEAAAEPARPSTDLPVPLRVWLTRTDPVKPVYVGWSGFWGTLSVLVTGVAERSHGNGTEVAVTCLVLALLPLLPAGLFRLIETRRVLRAGYTLDDLRLALRQHLDRIRDEMDFVNREPSWPGRLLRVLSYLGFTATAAVGVVMLLWPETLSRDTGIGAFLTLGFGAFVAAVLGVSYPGRRINAEPSGKRRLALWESRLGTLIARVAGAGLGWRDRVAGQAGMHRPTEMVIGLAADALFESLPARLKAQLRELPPLLRRLTDEAGRLRAGIDKLDAALAELGPDAAAAVAAPSRYADSAAAIAAQRRALAGDLRAERDAAAVRLGGITTALESVRLDLLRLQTGASRPESVTEILNAARRVNAAVDVAVSARAEADALVQRTDRGARPFPSPPDGSPA